jgi:hypothetical protein
MDLWDLHNKKCKTQIAAFILGTHHQVAKERTHVCQFRQATILHCQISEIMKGRNSMVKLE